MNRNRFPIFKLYGSLFIVIFSPSNSLTFQSIPIIKANIKFNKFIHKFICVIFRLSLCNIYWEMYAYNNSIFTGKMTGDNDVHLEQWRSLEPQIYEENLREINNSIILSIFTLRGEKLPVRSDWGNFLGNFWFLTRNVVWLKVFLRVFNIILP